VRAVIRFLRVPNCRRVYEPEKRPTTAGGEPRDRSGFHSGPNVHCRIKRPRAKSKENAVTRRGVMSAAAYCALSVSVSLLNAHVVTFLPSVTPLLAAQAASTSLALALASRVGPREVCVGACREFPLALAFSAALWTRMEANRHASQSTILVARHLVPLVILPMERVVLGRRAPAELAAPLVAVALGAFAFARGARPENEEYSSPRRGGVVLAAHVLVTAAQLVMAKASVGDVNGSGGGRRKRAAYAAGVNAAMALVFLAASALRRRSAFYFWSTDVTTMTSARLFATLATIPLSILIVHVQTETQAKSSAAGFAALNNAAKAFSVVGSVAIGERAPTSASLIGLVATLIGGLWYARVSARLKARPEALVPKKEKKKRS
jgi:hypothetical protein